MAKRYLVTSALPYANGVVHLGHIAGAYLPADVYARWRRLRGDDVIYVCGNDDHGVPTTIAAEKEGLTPRELTDKYYDKNVEAFRGLDFSFDIFSRTSVPEHAKNSQQFFLNLHKAGYIVEKEGDQFYCEQCKRYLPDRYVLGTCPSCGTGGARGDQCENCGKWYETLALKDPYCRDCKTPPIVRKTRHWYFELEKFQEPLKKWLAGRKGWRDNVVNFAKGWLGEGLHSRAITRDIAWGVPVPLEEAKGKVLYVWFDAPIGYLTFTQQYFREKGEPEKWRDYWQSDDCDLIHFIGKDNIVFHALVWPAMLMGQENFILPSNIPANEFLTFGGEKGSKTRGNAITVPEYLEKFPADPLRYYLTINAPEAKDANFTWEDFAAKNNDDLADVFGNLYHRIQTFAHRYFKGRMPAGVSADAPVMKRIAETREKVDAHLEAFRIRDSLREVLNLGRWGNKFFDDEKPWVLRKEDNERCAGAIAQCLELCAALAIFTHPYMPHTAAKLWNMLGLAGETAPIPDAWNRLGTPLLAEGHELNKPDILFKKIETVPS